MDSGKRLLTGIKVGHGDAAPPILAIVGPLLGLVYVMVLPFIGVPAVILLLGYRATQSLTTIMRKGE